MLAVLASPVPLSAESVKKANPPAHAFLTEHCSSCHEGAEASGGLNLEKLQSDLDDPATEAHWIRIYDRIQSGEMPPPEDGKLPQSVTGPFLDSVTSWLTEHQKRQIAKSGRVHGRRLTNRELERTLQDLLGIDIPLLEHFPEEPQRSEFSTMPIGQSISHFDVERHLAVVDIALDEAFRRALSRPFVYDKEFEARQIARSNPKAFNREPEMLNGKAVIWSAGVIYYGRTPVTTAPEDGWYRFRLTISGLNLPKTGGVWTTVYQGPCVSSAPLLTWVTAIEAEEKPKTVEFETYMTKGHMLEIRPGDITLKRGRFGGQVGAGEGEPQNVPGIAMEHLTMEKFHRGPDDAEIRQRLFGDIKLNEVPLSQSQKSRSLQKIQWSVDSKGVTPEQVDALLVSMASRAFRRPVEASEIQKYCDLARSVLQRDRDVVAALRAGYRALLCSPRFLYVNESPGKLDSYELASRLSYFLTGSLPDQELQQLAETDSLRNPDVISGQVERLLTGESGRRFLKDFAAEWLELNQIDFTQPDRRLFPDFDKIVENSMLEETHLFLEQMLKENQNVSGLVNAKQTWLNSRLARYYGITDVEGDQMRLVSLKPESSRAGLLTHGSVLKVTANGTSTSPVLRGVWVARRILGDSIPPPPENVPAVEPDTRGSTTIRELLEKHRADVSCASCHRKIDPPGFALENYDAGGKWRDRYGPKGAKIDPSSQLLTGEKFRDLKAFQTLVASRPEMLARNLAEKLVTYGTGAPIAFSERSELDRIVSEAAKDDYGFRSIVHAVIASPLFLQK